MTSIGRAGRAAVVLSSLVFAAVAVAAVGQLAFSDRIERSDGCGFDGFYYCAMLRGDVVAEPFNRRILLPFLAGKIDADGLTGFWVVSVLSLVAAAALAMGVAWKLRTAAMPLALVPPLAVGAAFLSARNTFHLTATDSALSDALGLLLVVAGVALVVLPLDPVVRLALVPVAFFAPLAREQLSVVLPAGLLLAGRARLLPWNIALASSAAAIAGAVVGLTRPSRGTGYCLTPDKVFENCPGDVWDTLWFWLEWDFGSADGLFRFLTMAALGIGLAAAAIGILRLRSSHVHRARWIASVAGIFALVSVFGGGDTDRVLMPAGLLLVLALAVGAGRDERALLGLALAVGAFAIQQEPFTAVEGTDAEWLAFFGLRTTSIEEVVRHGLVPTLVALPLAMAAFLLVRQAVHRQAGERRESSAAP